MASLHRPVAAGLLVAAALLSCRNTAFATPPNLPRTADSQVIGVAQGPWSARRPEGASPNESFWNPLAAGTALGLAIALVTAPAALAADGNLTNGEDIFMGTCQACHAGGLNLVQAEKTLKKEALEKFGMYDVEKVKYQVTNGKNAMPAFQGRISDEDIADVSAYVMSKAQGGW